MTRSINRRAFSSEHASVTGTLRPAPGRHGPSESRVHAGLIVTGKKQPLAPNAKSPRIFYGWYVVVGLALISAVMTGMGGINLGLFIAPMEKDLGIGRSIFGLAQTARLIGFSL